MVRHKFIKKIKLMAKDKLNATKQKLFNKELTGLHKQQIDMVLVIDKRRSYG